MKSFLILFAIFGSVGLFFWIKYRIENATKIENVKVASESREEPLLKPTFTPDQLAILGFHNNKNKIAGECLSRNFFEFIDSKNDGHHFYSYYFSPQVQAPMYRGDYIAGMNEQITFSDSGVGFRYTIKSNDLYSNLINSIKEHYRTPANTWLDSLYQDNWYELNGCVFVAEGYIIDDKGHSIYIASIDSLKRGIAARLKKKTKVEKDDVKIIKDEEPDKKEYPKEGIIAVNKAEAYHQIGETAFGPNSMTVSKGQRLNIRMKISTYYYCDFADFTGEEFTAWFDEKDVDLIGRRELVVPPVKKYDDIDAEEIKPLKKRNSRN